MTNLSKIKENEQSYISFLSEGKVFDAIKNFNAYKNELEIFYKENEYSENIISTEILKLIKNFIQNLNKFAKDYMQKEDYENAILCYSEILKYLPKDIACLSDYIICLYKTSKFETQHKVLNYLLEIIPKDNYKAYKRLAYTYSYIDCLEKAIEYQEKFLNLCPKNEINEGDYALIGMLCKDFYLESSNISYCYKGIEYLTKGLSIYNEQKVIIDYLHRLYSFVNEEQKALEYLKKLFLLGNPTIEDKFNYAVTNFKIKNFREFYKYYDVRLKLEKFGYSYFFDINKPKWQGENISDKTLLILYEQGFGDTLLMYGYIPRLVKLAKKVKFIVQDEIYPLLKNNKFGIEILKFSTTNIEDIDFDYYIPAMSIMSALNLDENNISVGAGYIQADNDLVKTYKESYFNNNSLKIGFSFLGNFNPNSKMMNGRNIPVKEFLPLDKLDNIELYSLSKGVDNESFKDFKNNNVHNLSDKLITFKDTAAFIENCDLIISSDNVILNLAGAMGKQTFGLFNWYYEWRWYDLTGEDVCWYSSVKPFVNTSMNDWQSSMTRVVNEIKKLQQEKFK